MIKCELCGYWQHAVCFMILTEPTLLLCSWCVLFILCVGWRSDDQVWAVWVLAARCLLHDTEGRGRSREALLQSMFQGKNHNQPCQFLRHETDVLWRGRGGGQGKNTDGSGRFAPEMQNRALENKEPLKIAVDCNVKACSVLQIFIVNGMWKVAPEHTNLGAGAVSVIGTGLS